MEVSAAYTYVWIEEPRLKKKFAPLFSCKAADFVGQILAYERTVLGFDFQVQQNILFYKKIVA